MQGARFFVVVPAAGIGQRMQSECPKQYLPLVNGYLADQTLSRLLAVSALQTLAVALHPQDAFWSRLKHANHARITTCEGGASRADSVLAALTHLEQLGATANDWVLVHDMARPCVRVSDIEKLMAAANLSGAILAAPVVDTVKQSSSNLIIKKTLDRSRIWRALTPQLFALGQLKNALISARQKGQAVTDEASAVELLGLQPRLIEGAADNIKVTHPADLALADFYLQRQAKEQQT